MPTTKFSISEIHDGPTASTQEDKDTLSTSSTKQIHTSPIAFKSTTLVLTTTTEESQKATIFKNFTGELKMLQNEPNNFHKQEPIPGKRICRKS